MNTMSGGTDGDMKSVRITDTFGNGIFFRIVQCDDPYERQVARNEKQEVLVNSIYSEASVLGCYSFQLSES